MQKYESPKTSIFKNSLSSFSPSLLSVKYGRVLYLELKERGIFRKIICEKKGWRQKFRLFPQSNHVKLNSLSQGKIRSEWKEIIHFFKKFFLKKYWSQFIKNSKNFLLRQKLKIIIDTFFFPSLLKSCTVFFPLENNKKSRKKKLQRMIQETKGIKILIL